MEVVALLHIILSLEIPQIPDTIRFKKTSNSIRS